MELKRMEKSEVSSVVVNSPEDLWHDPRILLPQYGPCSVFLLLSVVPREGNWQAKKEALGAQHGYQAG